MTNATNNLKDPFVTVSMLDNRFVKFKDEIIGSMNEMLSNLTDHMDEQFMAVEARLDEHDKKFDLLLATENVQNARIDRLELLVNHLYPKGLTKKHNLRQ